MSHKSTQPSEKKAVFDFSQIEESLREETKRRYEYVKKVLEDEHKGISGERLKPIIQEVSKEISDNRPPSCTSLYRWVKSFKEKERNIIALVPDTDQRGNRTQRLMSEVQVLMHEVVCDHYMVRHRPTVVDAYQFLISSIDNYNNLNTSFIKLPIPSIDALYRHIDLLDPYDILVARYGKRYADMHMTQYVRGVRANKILERVEMDHSLLPIMVVDYETHLPLGRPYLTVAIDTYSRCILGFYLSFEPPSILSVSQCLKHAIMPKDYIENIPNVHNKWNVYGIPEVLVVDNGKEFHSSDFIDACLQLYITVQYAPPKTPWFKPAVERYFGTINKQLLQNQPGTTFCSIFDKKDYDPVRHAVISYESLLEIIHIFIIDIYQRDKHRGSQIVPFIAWDKSAEEYPPTIPDNTDELNILLGRVEHRTISAKGIEFECILYNSPELIRLRTRPHSGESMKIKYNPADLNVIYVYDPNQKGFIPVPSMNPEYTEKLSLWQHRVCKRFAREQYGNTDIINLAHARVRIAKIVESDFSLSKVKTRQKMGRWMSTGILSTAEEVEKKAMRDRSQNEKKPAPKGKKESKDSSVKKSFSTSKVAYFPEKKLEPALPISAEELHNQGWGVCHMNVGKED